MEDFLFTKSAAPKGTRFSEIRTFPVIDSTNRYLQDAALEGEPEGLVVIAAHQSEGRGRHGRRWDSKPGSSLLLSVLLRPRDVTQAQRTTNAMGLAVADACKVVGGFSAQLKWPNDVIVDGKKIAGVLAELVDDDKHGVAVVVGSGVNLNWADSIPESLEQVATSADLITGAPVDNAQFADALLRALHERLARPSWLAQAYRERCATIGQRVRVVLPDDEFVGIAKDVDDNGALVVALESGETRTITAGEVTHLRSESAS